MYNLSCNRLSAVASLIGRKAIRVFRMSVWVLCTVLAVRLVQRLHSSPQGWRACAESLNLLLVSDRAIYTYTLFGPNVWAHAISALHGQGQTWHHVHALRPCRQCSSAFINRFLLCSSMGRMQGPALEVQQQPLQRGAARRGSSGGSPPRQGQGGQGPRSQTVLRTSQGPATGTRVGMCMCRGASIWRCGFAVCWRCMYPCTHSSLFIVPIGSYHWLALTSHRRWRRTVPAAG